MNLSPGIYEALFDRSLKATLERHPELRSIFGKLEADEEPARLAAFVSKVLEQALRLEVDSTARFQLCNELISKLCGPMDRAFLAERHLIGAEKPVLLEITPPS